MNNRDRKNNKSSVIGVGVIAIVMLLMEAVTSAAMGGGAFIGMIVAVLFIGILGFVIAFAMAKKLNIRKTKVYGYQAERGKEVQKRSFMRDNLNEKAVKCAHPRGKEKYFVQLDGFLANGIIDKNEYRVLKERYEKVVIPENMH